MLFGHNIINVIVLCILHIVLVTYNNMQAKNVNLSTVNIFDKFTQHIKIMYVTYIYCVTSLCMLIHLKYTLCYPAILHITHFKKKY